MIKAHHFPVQKKFGQNFLIDENVLSSIVEAADIGPEDCVLEIGPGMGALTGYLLDSARKVIAVEVDKMLIPILKGTVGKDEKLILINDDILKVDLDSLIERENDGRPIKVVANLPYYITTPIIMELLGRGSAIESITVMIQKEVAERMTEGPGSKAYGALSLAVAFYSKAHAVMTVSKNSFYPRPDVDSAVIRLDVYKPDERPVKCADPDQMFRIIKAAFGQRRKTLANALSHSADLNFSREEVENALCKMEKSESIRGEVLTLQEFAALSDLLSRP